MDKVDATMSEMADQTALANEVADAISNPAYSGTVIDEVILFCFSSYLTDH
jgi:hypothetical protein